MAFEGKVSLLNQIEKRIGSDVAFDTMPKIMSAISDILQGFEVIETGAVNNGPDDLLDCYLDALRVQGRSPKTIDRYAYIIGRMMDTLKIPTRQITVYHLRTYLSKEQARGVQDSTLEGTREVFTAYFNWLHREAREANGIDAWECIVDIQQKRRPENCPIIGILEDDGK